MAVTNRKEIEKLVYDIFDALDPSGVNTAKYKKVFQSMDDTKFESFLKRFLEDDKDHFCFDLIEFQNEMDFNNVEKAAAILNIPLMEYLYLPHLTMDKNNIVCTREKCFVGYLNIKRYTREKNREIKRGLLEKENTKIKERLYHTKSVIDNRALDLEFQKLKKISGYLRKVHPQDSVGKIFLNRKESQIIRQYEKEKAEFLLKTKRNKQNFIASADNIKLKSYKTTTRINNPPFSIDKRILRKIAYV